MVVGDAMGMQPPPPAPPSSPHLAPALRRGYGLMVLLASLAGALFLAILLILIAAALLALSVALMAVMTGAGEIVPEDVPGVVWVALAVCGAALLVSIALDAVVTVQSARRLDGRHGDRAVPIINLIAVLLATVAPLLLAAVLTIGFLIPSEAVLSVATVALMTALSVAAPTARIAQFVTGILLLRSGEPGPGVHAT